MKLHGEPNGLGPSCNTDQGVLYLYVLKVWSTVSDENMEDRYNDPIGCELCLAAAKVRESLLEVASRIDMQLIGVSWA